MTDFSNLSFPNAGELIDNTDVSPPKFILKGLEAGHVGLLIAAPEMGKSHLSMSIAIEHSTGYELVGLTAAQAPSKTLMISAEDSVGIIRGHLSAKLDCLSKPHKELARANIFPFSAQHPFIAPYEAPSHDKATIKSYISQITGLIKKHGIDLVIVDTVSEVIGACDEVRHDRQIKMAFQQLAKESGAAVLLVHHVNKAEIRGENQVTMASGAGLTTVMRLAKLILGIEQLKDAKQVNFLKANYLTPEEKESFAIKFDGALLVRDGLLRKPAKRSKFIKSKSLPSEELSPIIAKHVSPPESEVPKKNIRNAF